jgi:hypothetical protein
MMRKTSSAQPISGERSRIGERAADGGLRVVHRIIARARTPASFVKTPAIVEPAALGRLRRESEILSRRAPPTIVAGR